MGTYAAILVLFDALVMKDVAGNPTFILFHTTHKLRQWNSKEHVLLESIPPLKVKTLDIFHSENDVKGSEECEKEHGEVEYRAHL